MDELSILRARVVILERQVKTLEEALLYPLRSIYVEEEEDEEMEESTPMAD